MPSRSPEDNHYIAYQVLARGDDFTELPFWQRGRSFKAARHNLGGTANEFAIACPGIQWACPKSCVA